MSNDFDCQSLNVSDCCFKLLASIITLVRKLFPVHPSVPSSGLTRGHLKEKMGGALRLTLLENASGNLSSIPTAFPLPHYI
jgi:hypothetical protein